MVKGQSPEWNRRIMSIADQMASWSKDPSTQVGAVIVDYDRRILSTGYNGFAPGSDDSLMSDRDYKLANVIHAERNAILHAAHDLTGSNLYVTHPCCEECAKFIHKSGIASVVWKDNPAFAQRWNSSDAISQLTNNGVNVTIISASGEPLIAHGRRKRFTR